MVEVYYNLHKHMYSIRDRATGLVVAHADTVALTSGNKGGSAFKVRPKVSEAGRQRVLNEKRKNVHALLVGAYAGSGLRIEDEEKDGWRQLYYNPYKTSTFVDKETGMPVHDAHFVLCQDKQAYYVE